MSPADLDSIGVMSTDRQLTCETCGETGLHLVGLYAVEPDEIVL